MGLGETMPSGERDRASGERRETRRERDMDLVRGKRERERESAILGLGDGGREGEGCCIRVTQSGLQETESAAF